MDDFINVNKKDPRVRVKMNDMLDRYNRLPYNCKSKIFFDNLFQNVILKELINIISTIITDLDLELKMKISRNDYSESRFPNVVQYMYKKCWIFT